MATRAARKPQPAGSATMHVASAVTASAARVRSLPTQQASGRRVQPWQMDSFAYYDQIGAVRYAAQFTARALAKVRWFPATRDRSGEVTEITEGPLVDAFDRVQDEGGGRAVMVSAFAQLDFLVGEEQLLWTAESDKDEESWEVVSTLELRKMGRRGDKDIYHRIKAPGLTPEELIEAPDEDFEAMSDNVQVYRWWRRHPVYSQLADSPMRSVLPDCEEIVRTTHTINARLISRLSGPGILAIPQSWTLLQGLQVVGEENPQEHPFLARLTKAMVTAVNNPGSAESVVPIVVVVPDHTLQEGAKAQMIKIWDPNETIREVELREKAVHRFAIGVEMPPEKVEGLSTSGTQHWNAWMVDEDAWAHIDPVAQSFADNLASSYLRPWARENNIADWRQVCIGYDPAEVLTNPDGFADAKALYEARAVGKAYLRAAANVDDDEAMTDEELMEALFALTRIQVEVANGKIEVPEPVAPAPIPPAPPGEETPSGPNGDGPSTGEDTPRAAPEVPEGMATYRLLGAAEVTLEDIRARVGTRLRNHIRGKCAECFEQTKGIRPGTIAFTLGPEVVLEYGPDLVGLAVDGGRSFVETAVRMGVSPTQAQALAEVLELHAISTIYEQAPELPAGFVGRVRALAGS